MKSIQGECLCGAVQYEILNDVLYAGFCHCSECRRFSGSAFSAFAGVTSESLHITNGLAQIKYYKKSEDSQLAFCSECGSSLFSFKPKTGMYHIRMGTLNDAPSLYPQAHVYVGSKAKWDSMNDDLPKFDQGPPQMTKG